MYNTLLHWLLPKEKCTGRDSFAVWLSVVSRKHVILDGLSVGVGVECMRVHLCDQLLL